MGGMRMVLEIAFIGYNREQTRRHFKELCCANREQATLIDLRRGVLVLNDGTVIRRIDEMLSSSSFRFDQIIIADDRRRNIFAARPNELVELEVHVMSSVPEEFRRIFYNTDWKPEDGQ